MESLEKIFDTVKHLLDSLIQSTWLGTVIAVVVILAITALISFLARRLVLKLLNKSTLLPTNTIFVNVVRVIIWSIGLGTMLSLCFNVNVNALITALGVGGIAISLGFQDTISNLIGGLTVSVSRLVEPGENISLPSSGLQGEVKDVTWRHTTIKSSGTTVVVPNSVINSTALVKLQPQTHISIPLVMTVERERLTAVAHIIESKVAKAVARVDKIKKAPSISFTAITAHGFQGTLSFVITDKKRVSDATDAAIRAAAPYVHAHPDLALAEALEQKLDVPDHMDAVDIPEFTNDPENSKAMLSANAGQDGASSEPATANNHEDASASTASKKPSKNRGD